MFSAKPDTLPRSKGFAWHLRVSHHLLCKLLAILISLTHHNTYKPLRDILSIAAQFGEFCCTFVSHTTALLCYYTMSSMAPPSGLEPLYHESESCMLPLYHGGIWRAGFQHHLTSAFCRPSFKHSLSNSTLAISLIRYESTQ